VEWCPTLEPEHSLGHAKELVDTFETQLRAHSGGKSGRGGLGLDIQKAAAVEAGRDCSGGHLQSRNERGIEYYYILHI
jgi:hypothetical protein